MKKLLLLITVFCLCSSTLVFADTTQSNTQTNTQTTEKPEVHNPELPFDKTDKKHGLMRLCSLIEERYLQKGEIVTMEPLKIVPSKSKLNRYSLIVDSNRYKLNGTWVIDLVEPTPENMSITKAHEKSKNYQYWFNYYDKDDKILHTCWVKYCPCNEDRWPDWIKLGKE